MLLRKEIKELLQEILAGVGGGTSLQVTIDFSDNESYSFMNVISLPAP